MSTTIHFMKRVLIKCIDQINHLFFLLIRGGFRIRLVPLSGRWFPPFCCARSYLHEAALTGLMLFPSLLGLYFHAGAQLRIS
jgi:hypothetical protein